MRDVTVGESDGARRTFLCTSCRATLCSGERCDVCPSARRVALDDEEALDGVSRKRPEQRRPRLGSLVGTAIVTFIIGGIVGGIVGGMALLLLTLFDFIYSLFTGHWVADYGLVIGFLFGAVALGGVIQMVRAMMAELKPRRAGLLPGAALVRPSPELDTFEGVVVSERVPAALGLLALRDNEVLASYGHVHALVVRGDRGELAIAGRVRLLRDNEGIRERLVDADAFEQVLPCPVDVLEANWLLQLTLEPGDRVRVHGSLHCEQLPSDYREEPEERWQLEGVPWLELLEVG